MQRKYPKILILAGWYPNTLYEGEGDFIKFQAELMYKHGYNVAVFHSNLSYKYIFKGIWKKVSKSDTGLPEHLIEKAFIPRNSGGAMNLWSRWVLKDSLTYIEENGVPDLIHAHTYLGGYIASLIQKTLGIPYIVTLHETAFLVNNIPNYHKPLVNKSLKGAKKVVCVGTKLSDRIKRLMDVNNVVIHNFIDFDRFIPKGERNDRFTFIYVGELIPRKNVIALLNAFIIVRDKFPKACLVIVGEGPETKKLNNVASKLGINEEATFKGRLSQKDVAYEMAMSHCLVLPSISETFGIVLVEAMACGLPIIASKSGGPSDIIGDEVGILLESNEPNKLAIAMIEMKRKYSDYDGEKIRELAKTKFSAEAVLKKYDELYSQVLK